MDHFIHLFHLHKSVWVIINAGIASGADLSVISPRCRLHANGIRVCTPQMSTVIHAVTDVDSKKLSARARRTTTTADLKKMFKDAICSGNLFEIKPTELANRKYQLPRLAHYDGPVDMGSIVEWLRNSIGMTPYMVHVHFRPFPRRVYETTPTKHHREFSPDHLYPNESVAPVVNDSLTDFPESRDWTPDRGPRGRLLIPFHRRALR